MLDSLGRGLPDQDMIWKVSVAQEVYPLANWENIILAQLQGKPLAQEALYLLCHPMQELLILVQQDEIVTVTDVVLDFVLVLQVLIKLVHVEVAQPLRRIIPDWHVLAAWDAVDDVFQQPERIRTLDLSLDYLKEDAVVDGRIELANIHLQTVSSGSCSSDKFHCPSAGRVNAFPYSARIRITDEEAVPNRLKNVHEGVLNYPVRIEGQLVYDSLLGFEYHLFNIRRCGECFLNQRISDIENILIQIVIEAANGILPALALSGPLISQVDIIQIRYLLKEISMSLHNNL